MPSDTQAAPSSEVGSRELDELTREWRQLQFERLGFENAKELAESSVDWHEAAALIAAGATPKQVTRILSESSLS